HLQTQEFLNEPGNPNSLSYNHVTSFLDDPNDPDQYLWISTKGGGINRMNKSERTFIHFDKDKGLPDNIVYGVLADKQGHIWGSTNQGLFCMLQDSSGEFYFRNFSKSDGLQENEFNSGAFARLPDGRLVFGGINGYNIFDPEIILTPELHAPTMITNLLVNNQPVRPNDDSGILEEPIEYANKIRLPPSAKIFTLQFAALNYFKSDRVKYRYLLEGAHDHWVENGQNRTATFVQLKPKEYTFRVQGSNSQGLWSDQVAELRIQIIPPWWRSSWATILYLSLGVGAIWIAFRIIVYRSNLRRQLAYEKKEAERVKELDSLKTQLYMNMTHEFRTPLTVILGMARQIQENPKDNFRSGLEMIIRNGQNLLGMVNRMLSLSKLENGKMTLELASGDIIAFMRNIVEAFRSFLSNKNIQTHFLPEVDQVWMEYDPDKLQQVISNLISNAYKFTPEGGHIYFTVRRQDEMLLVKIKDTGSGISANHLDKVFDRFYQADESVTRKHEGTGIGLALCKELVALMKGEISVLSPPVGARKGTEFTVQIPIKEVIPAHGIKAIPLASSSDLSQSIMKDAISKTVDMEELVDPMTTAEETIPLILLVEDNPDVAGYIAACLADFRLLVAGNGKEGFELAREYVPDIIVSDVMMPEMDGFTFCEKIKSDEQTNHIPVILLTARADFDSKMEGLQHGANAYLAKPFEKQELLVTIQNLITLRDKSKRHYQRMTGLRVQTGAEIEEDTLSNPDDPFLVKVREAIAENISDFNFNVEQLAGIVHLSHSQLARKLDALIGYSPNQLIRHLRLDKAKQLLRNSDLSIGSIAYECGFIDPSYFSRVFKKEVGETPAGWRSAEVSD
ncbi:MAG: response regulator, partial [Saprospiraceae bacterium]|nr:response regulator [Saprospiraceae bacterium]